MTGGPWSISGVGWLAAVSDEVPEGGHWLSPEEQAKQATLMFAKRRDDWRLKRWAAKQALHRVCGVVALDRLQVLNTEDGEPIAFDGSDRLPIAISLTDRDGTAVCALAPADARLGCDLELVEPRSEAFVSDWLTPAEQQAVAAAEAAARSDWLTPAEQQAVAAAEAAARSDWLTPAERQAVASAAAPGDVVANLIWSAKEAALKALGIGLRRPTRQVEVEIQAGHQAEDIAGGLWAPLQVVVEEGLLPGWWRRYRGFVLTVVTDATGPPGEL